MPDIFLLTTNQYRSTRKCSDKSVGGNYQELHAVLKFTRKCSNRTEGGLSGQNENVEVIRGRFHINVVN
jgi:hypothetical protein